VVRFGLVRSSHGISQRKDLRNRWLNLACLDELRDLREFVSFGMASDRAAADTVFIERGEAQYK
jgi:hypothetical protein